MAFDTALDANLYQKGEGIYNAGHSDFGSDSDTDVSRIQAAIDAAKADGVPRVLVPDSMLGYGSGVTFDNDVLMVWSGGPRNKYDPIAYGAVADGVADDTTPLQEAINAAANNHGTFHIPDEHFIFDRLFFHHDATDNPGFPSGDREQGRMKVTTDGFPMAVDNVRNGDRHGPVLESTNTSNPCLSFVYDVAGNPYRQMEVGGFTVIQDIAGFVVDVNRLNSNGRFGNITIFNPNTGGSAMKWANGFNINPHHIWAVAPSAGSSGEGFRFDVNTSKVPGAGIFNMEQLNAKDFDTNYVFGGSNGASAKLYQSQGNGGVNSVDFEAGWRVNFDACHFEGYTSRGIWVRNEGRVQVDGLTRFGGSSGTEADIDVGDPAGANATEQTGSAVIIETDHQAINSNGIRYQPTGNESSIVIIKPRLRGNSGSETGIRFTGSAINGAVLIGPRFDNLGTNIAGVGSDSWSGWLDDGTIRFGPSGASVGFFEATPAGQQSALTAQDSATVDGTYGTEEEGVIQNNRTRLAEIESALQAYGLLP